MPVRKRVCSTQQGLSCHSTNKKLLQTGRSKNRRLGQLSLSGGLLESRLRAQVAVSIQSKMYSNTHHLRPVTGGWWPAFLLWLPLSWTWKKSWAKRVPDCSNIMSSFSRAPKNFHRMSVAASTSTHVPLSTAEMNLNPSLEPSPTTRHLKALETKQSTNTAFFQDYLFSSFVLTAPSSCSQKCQDKTRSDGTRKGHYTKWKSGILGLLVLVFPWVPGTWEPNKTCIILTCISAVSVP